MWSPIHTETNQNSLSLSSHWPSGWYCAMIVTVCPAPFSAAAACSWDAPRRSMPFTWKRGSQRILVLRKACYSDVCPVAQSCLTLCNPMDSSPPGSSVYGSPQARVLEWAAISSSRGSSRPRDWPTSLVSPALAGGFFTNRAPEKALYCKLKLNTPLIQTSQLNLQ